MLDNFAVLILTHGRPNNVKTLDTLRRQGYTGAVHLVVDDMDPTADEYRKQFGDMVQVFDKQAAWEQTDSRTNSGAMGSPLYARNASFDIAEGLGVRYFVQLDDDYSQFNHRVLPGGVYAASVLADNMDAVFEAMLDFFKVSGATSIAFSQGGDMMGGALSPLLGLAHRKCMNSFFCSTDRRFAFEGLMNDDVNTYTRLASVGALFMTVGQVMLGQEGTQVAAGGITELYLQEGTYVKSFFTVLGSPSCVKVAAMGQSSMRMHHRVAWRNAVPQIVPEHYRGNPHAFGGPPCVS